MTLEETIAAVPEEKRLSHNLRIAASNRANGDPLPGALSAAFTKSAIKVGPAMVRKIVASDWIVLRALNSPIIKLVEELAQRGDDKAAPPPEVDITDQDEWDIAFQFTRAPSDVRKAMEGGPKEFRARAMEAIGDTLESATVKLIGIAVLEQIRRTWATPLQYKQDMDKEGEVTFFLDASQETKTASAGGSNTSADSGKPSAPGQKG